MRNKYELLAPVGNFAMLHAAVDAGADAVYFGLQSFNMRATAKNFTIKDLPEMRKVCNSSPRKPKLYLTMNTIIYQNELKQVENFIKQVKGKVDAIICWDLSVIQLCKKYKIPFHISTQASISNLESAKFYQNLGAERIVLARELSLKQVKELSKKVKVGIECFCHGAMCVSESGRCFISQFLYGKSANRGECVHPCRREYKVCEVGNESTELVLDNNRVMSAKDLCTLPFIEQMKKAGIMSFKIEGRNRNPEYVSSVTKVYRKALDKKLSEKEIKEALEELQKVYNRGFSSGFYLRLPTSEDFSKSDSGEQTEKKVFVGKVEKYWDKVGVAFVKMNFGPLKVGDEVYILGDKTGVVRYQIESMQIEKQDKQVVNKGDSVGIKLPMCRRGDDVYVIKKKV
jgi:putative protease